MEALPRKMAVLLSLSLYTRDSCLISRFKRLFFSISLSEGRVYWISCRLWKIQWWNLLLKRLLNRSLTSPRLWKSSLSLKALVRPPPQPFWLLTPLTLLHSCPTRLISIQFLCYNSKGRILIHTFFWFLIFSVFNLLKLFNLMWKRRQWRWLLGTQRITLWSNTCCLWLSYKKNQRLVSLETSVFVCFHFCPNYRIILFETWKKSTDFVNA